MADDDSTTWLAKLEGKTGQAAWRSLAELLESPELSAAADQELPAAAARPLELSRRRLFKLLGASMALAGVSGCRGVRGREIVPYVTTPPDVTPGVRSFYATSMDLDGFATGLLVESHEGRPTKIEGNPEHPASLGATSVYEQASVLGLYDPYRARALRSGAGPASWEAFAGRFAAERRDAGAGLRFVLQPTGSPLMRDLIARVLARHPAARFTPYAPTASGHGLRGAEIALGGPRQAIHDFSAASRVLALDADFLASMPFSARYARQFAERRRPSSPASDMSRLYVVEPGLSPTGTMADHRLRCRPSEIVGVAAGVAAALFFDHLAPAGKAPAALAAALEPYRSSARQTLTPEQRRFTQALARDLARHAGDCVIVAGDRQPPEVHALSHVMNALLGNEQATWTIEPTLIALDGAQQSLPALARELESGAVDTLVILEANVSYTAPADLELTRLIRAVPERVYLGLYEDETAADCAWFVPAAHYLEAWGDARAYDGTISMVQPLIEPLWGGRTAAEVLAVFAGEARPSARRLLHGSWAARRGGPGFDAFWQTALQRGLVEGTESPRVRAELDLGRLTPALQAMATAPPAAPDALEVAFAPDPSVYDGRFANNAWLLELPDPVTKLTWDNAAQLSPATAEELGVEDGDLVDLERRGRALRMPVLIVPGHADGVATLNLGYGRRGGEMLGRGVGFDTYQLRTTDAPFFAEGLSITKRPGERHPLALTQRHVSSHGRPLALSAPLSVYREHPDLTRDMKVRLPSILPPSFRLPGALEQWAMTIDLSICTGCSACVVACQAENNVLVVGKDEVLNSREMHWLRIDTYYTGEAESPEVVHEPMLCQHCEKAPCEYVCPVNATTHSPDGLNEMTYNRCVGTRFCSNNCPYKVRRFNWYDWGERRAENGGLAKLQRNPDVTVRERGVMEKCTYCVQRIRRVEMQASIEQRSIRPGEVITACAQACPTQAIQFGALAHEETKMVQWRNEPRSYAALYDLNTRPRTMYLARITNKNPELD